MPTQPKAPSQEASTAELGAATKAVREATLNAVWRQWAVIGAAASAGRAKALVDAEALVLASLWLMDEEPRLSDLTASWVVTNTEYLSVQRIKNVAASFPASIGSRLSSLARLAVEGGKDFRWRSLVQADVPAMAERRGAKTLSVPVPVARPSALMLRLRVLLGVGIRADIIAFLLTGPDDYASSEDIAAATAYNPTAVRRVLAQLAAGDWLRYAGGTYPGYSLKGSRLAGITGLPASEVPNWRYLAQVYALVVEYLSWWREAGGRHPSAFAVSVKGDELFERHRRAFVDTGLVERHRTAGVGDDWPAELRRLAAWFDKMV
jgi:hypothetical protein